MEDNTSDKAAGTKEDKYKKETDSNCESNLKDIFKNVISVEKINNVADTECNR